MKLNVALFLSAMSLALLGSPLNAECEAPVIAIAEETACDLFDCCAPCVDHPLYPVCNPHLVSVGADFLFARPYNTVRCKRAHRTTFMPGATLGYDYLHPDQIYVGVHGETGWIAQNSHKYFSERPSFADLRVGYNFSMINDMGYALVSPYVGIGYARSKSTFAHTSHIRAAYWSVGVRSRFAICDNWSIGVDLQGVRTFAVHSCSAIRKGAATSSEAPSHVAGSHSACAVGKKVFAKTALKNRWTAEAALPVTYYMGERKEWSIEVSPYVSGLTLSRSRTAYGTRVTAGYRF